MEQNENWKAKTFLIGAALGATSGLLAAYFLVQRAEKEDMEAKLSAREGVQLSLGVLGLMKLITGS
jgi:hypothetical protein